MLLRRITLEDFGLYRGVQSFDLAPRIKYRRERPIILFGGKNGAGKTTLLEAVMVCLYGRTALGDRVRLGDYHEYLVRRIHQPAGQLHRPRQSSIAVEFDYVHLGVCQRYGVKRAWERKSEQSNSVEEVVLITRDGEPLGELDHEHWDDFLRDLIPPGLTQLFFFDGEKIQRLAEQPEDQELGRSIRSLLGLDLVDRLQADLQIYLGRQAKHTTDSGVSERILALEKSTSLLSEHIERLTQERARLQSQIDGTTSRVERLERELASHGGGFVKRREELVAERAELTTKIHSYEERLRELSSGLLPFALCPALCQQLRIELERESVGTRAAQATQLLEATVNSVLDRFVEGEIDGSKDIPYSERRRIADVLCSEFCTTVQTERHKATPPPQDGEHTIHALSEVDQRRIASWIEQSHTATADEARRIGMELEKSSRRLQAVERELAAVPPDEVVRPLIEELGEVQKGRGALLHQAEGIDEKIAASRRELDGRQREKARMVENSGEQLQLQDRIEKVKAVRNAMAEYLSRVTTLKLDELKQEIATCFNRMCRKGDLIRRIDIDPQSFAVTLYDRDGQALPRTRLSAGEKQIFAIAMLWALARTSGRPLPVIIDTPLGRLDSDHRRLLLEQYFPNAAHQVIILSTDTEVDEELFALLRPFISHAYHLVYDTAEACTRGVEGYFWKEQVDATESAKGALLR